MLTRRLAIDSDRHAVRYAPHQSRGGAITVWLILAIPVLLTLFCVVLEVGNLWLARTELTNALEASALAAVEEWGDGGGGDTETAREVGRIYALSNTINGAPVDYALVDPGNPINYNAANVNGNDSCDGTLIFGALIEDDPEFIFDSCSTSGCGGRFLVEFDVSDNGNLGGGDHNQWGISVQPTTMTNDIRVTRVIYRLPDSFMALNPIFDFTQFPARLSPNLVDNLIGNKVQCNATPSVIDCPGGPGGTSQADIFGVVPAEIEFYIDVPYGDDGGGGRLECVPGTGTLVTDMVNPAFQSKTLAVEFCDPEADPLCEPFDPGDRIRFGAFVRDNGGGQIDADTIGAMAADVTICFSDGSFVMVFFVDTMDTATGQNRACSNVTFPAWGNCFSPRQGMTISPTNRPDIPLPPSNAAGNNGQALTTFNDSTGSGLPFAVRAQATYQVPSICCEMFGIPVGPFNVTAKADALYECLECVPRLYHIEEDNFFCAVPCPAP